MTIESRIRMARDGVAIADRCVCHVCGEEFDFGDCCINDEGEVRCPICGGMMEEVVE